MALMAAFQQHRDKRPDAARAFDGGEVLSCSSVDWWSFGILMYELVFGYTPFRGNKRDQTFENILKRKLEFPAKPEISPALQVTAQGGVYAVSTM